MNIFNISQDYLILISQLEENEGELTPEIEEALKLTEENFEAKCIQYGWVLKHIQSDTDVIAAEIKRLQERKKAKEKAIERLKDVAQQAMVLFDKKKIETPTLTVSLRKSEAVVIEDDSKIPAEFLVEKTTISIDKTAIKSTIKSGGVVEGAFIQENQNLQIK